MGSQKTGTNALENPTLTGTLLPAEWCVKRNLLHALAGSFVRIHHYGFLALSQSKGSLPGVAWPTLRSVGRCSAGPRRHTPMTTRVGGRPLAPRHRFRRERPGRRCWAPGPAGGAARRKIREPHLRNPLPHELAPQQVLAGRGNQTEDTDARAPGRAEPCEVGQRPRRRPGCGHPEGTPWRTRCSTAFGMCAGRAASQSHAEKTSKPRFRTGRVLGR